MCARNGHWAAVALGSPSMRSRCWWSLPSALRRLVAARAGRCRGRCRDTPTHTHIKRKKTKNNSPFFFFFFFNCERKGVLRFYSIEVRGEWTVFWKMGIQAVEERGASLLLLCVCRNVTSHRLLLIQPPPPPLFHCWGRTQLVLPCLCFNSRVQVSSRKYCSSRAVALKFESFLLLLLSFFLSFNGSPCEMMAERERERRCALMRVKLGYALASNLQLGKSYEIIECRRESVIWSKSYRN